MYTIFVVSDGTGRTAQQALNAALTQFPNISVDIIKFSEVRTKEQVLNIVEEAAKADATIAHTLVKNNIRQAMVRAGRLHNIETIDLMGPLLSRLADQFENVPSQKPGLFHELNRNYFKRIDSMQFAFNHDDGLRTNELYKAEIVLLGVSRTFKTPLSIFLAFKGWFVANVPIILGIQPPDALFKIPTDRVFCLTTNSRRLSSLRQVREEYFGGNTGDYASLDYVRRELEYAQSIFNRQPKWSVIKVTSKPIEEIASEILAIIGKVKVSEEI